MKNRDKTSIKEKNRDYERNNYNLCCADQRIYADDFKSDMRNNINADNIPTKEGLDGNSDVLLDEE